MWKPGWDPGAARTKQMTLEEKKKNKNQWNPNKVPRLVSGIVQRLILLVLLTLLGLLRLLLMSVKDMQHYFYSFSRNLKSFKNFKTILVQIKPLDPCRGSREPSMGTHSPAPAVLLWVASSC